MYMYIVCVMRQRCRHKASIKIILALSDPPQDNMGSRMAGPKQPPLLEKFVLIEWQRNDYEDWVTRRIEEERRQHRKIAGTQRNDKEFLGKDLRL